MNEETTTASAPQPIGEKWGDPIDEARKQELWHRLHVWWDEADHGGRKGPFEKERLTGAEVFWLAVYALAECERRKMPANYVDARLSIDRMLLERAEGNLRFASANLKPVHPFDLSLLDVQAADLHEAQLETAFLRGAHLEGANLFGAQLEYATLREAHLDGVDLEGAELGGAFLARASLQGANLLHASLDKRTDLTDTILTDVRLDRVYIDNTNLSVVDWMRVPVLQDERIARRARYGDKASPDKRGKRKDRTTRKEEYQAAARAYRRLAVALQDNGMSEEAAKYAYRAQLMQRQVFRYSGWSALGKWLFSWFLWLIAGYGYRPGRSVVIYLGSVALFAVGYYLLGATIGPHLSPYEAAVVSLTAFHGRGFFATAFQPGDPQAGLAALEAVVGLLIEISFIATFTQRFFGSK